MPFTSIVEWFKENGGKDTAHLFTLDGTKLEYPVAIPAIKKPRDGDYRNYSRSLKGYYLQRITPETLLAARPKSVGESKESKTHFTCNHVQLIDAKSGQNAFHYVFQGIVQEIPSDSHNMIILKNDLPKVFLELKILEDSFEKWGRSHTKFSDTEYYLQKHVVEHYKNKHDDLRNQGLVHNKNFVEEKCTPPIIDILLAPFDDLDKNENLYDALSCIDKQGNMPLHYIFHNKNLSIFSNVFTRMLKLDKERRKDLLVAENNKKQAFFSLFIAKNNKSYWNILGSDIHKFFVYESSIGQNVFHIIFIENNSDKIEKIAAIKNLIDEKTFIDLIFKKDHSGKSPFDYLKADTDSLVNLYKLVTPEHVYRIRQTKSINTFEESSASQGEYKTEIRKKNALWDFVQYFIKPSSDIVYLAKLEDAATCISALYAGKELKACHPSLIGKVYFFGLIGTQSYYNLRTNLTLSKITTQAVEEVRRYFTSDTYISTLFTKLSKKDKELVVKNIQNLFSKLPAVTLDTAATKEPAKTDDSSVDLVDFSSQSTAIPASLHVPSAPGIDEIDATAKTSYTIQNTLSLEGRGLSFFSLFSEPDKNFRSEGNPGIDLSGIVEGRFKAASIMSHPPGGLKNN